MKKAVFLICCAGLIFSLSGCSVGNMADRFLSVGDTPVKDTTEAKPRVYMDEMKGILRDFTGDSIMISLEEQNYIFDVSNASLECENGMITGDEITLIYEGQLMETDTGIDTSQIKILKVVNDYRMHTDPVANSASGVLRELTPNRISFTLEDGKTITFPTTGCEEYFSGGIRTGVHVTVHYLGDLENAASDSASSYDAFHVKALTVSDVEPFAAPEPTPVPKSGAETSSAQTFQGEIQSLKTNVLTITVSDTQALLALDLSNLPAYFCGGPMPGSKVTVTYYGEFNGTTLDGVSPVSVTGEDPVKTNEYNLSFSVTGNIRGRTKNTVTVLTTDGAFVTFRTDDAEDLSTSGLETGADIRLIFNPAENKTTNVYSCIKIVDA